MSVEFDFSDDVVLVTGVGGALGSAIAAAYLETGATVCGADLVEPDSEDFLLDNPERIDFYQGDFTDESTVESTIDEIVDTHGGLDYLANVAGTMQPLEGGTVVLADAAYIRNSIVDAAERGQRETSLEGRRLLVVHLLSEVESALPVVDGGVELARVVGDCR